jgi:hypothetical protein
VAACTQRVARFFLHIINVCCGNPKVVSEPRLFSFEFVSPTRILLGLSETHEEALHQTPRLTLYDIKTGAMARFELPYFPAGGHLLRMTLQSDNTGPVSSDFDSAFSPMRNPLDRIILLRLVYQTNASELSFVYKRLCFVISTRPFIKHTNASYLPWSSWGPSHTRFFPDVGRGFHTNVVDGRMMLPVNDGPVRIICDFTRARVVNATNAVYEQTAVGDTLEDGKPAETFLPFIKHVISLSDVVDERIRFQSCYLCEDGLLFVCSLIYDELYV